MTTPTPGPTAEELREFGDVEEWKEAAVDPIAVDGGGPVVTFTWEELDELFAACKIVDEDSVSFVRRAALERVAEVLKHERNNASAAAD